MPPFRSRVVVVVRCTIALLACISGASLGVAQTQDAGAVVPSHPCHFSRDTPPRPGPACLLAHQELGALADGPVYWHIDTFKSQAAARSAQGSTGTIVADYGTVWLFTIAGEHWSAKGGTHIATIGPLPVRKAAAFSAEYIHSLFVPGMSAPIHKHSGPEAFYALDGDTCLEMPGGAQVGTGPGNRLIMPAGDPMLLMAVGTVPRRAFALILHDATLPATTRVNEWQPAGLCQARLGARGTAMVRP